jgi:hypothetical protein
MSKATDYARRGLLVAYVAALFAMIGDMVHRVFL